MRSRGCCGDPSAIKSACLLADWDTSSCNVEACDGSGGDPCASDSKEGCPEVRSMAKSPASAAFHVPMR